MAEKTFKVPDVSCEHCVKAIRDELGQITGVENVDVDIASKLVTVHHNGEVSEQQMIAGLDEAGYEIAR